MRRVPTLRWRGGRVAEGGGLLNRYTVNPVSWVRIPSPPPSLVPPAEPSPFPLPSARFPQRNRSRASEAVDRANRAAPPRVIDHFTKGRSGQSGRLLAPYSPRRF